jgi:hypothetical protein
MTLWLIAIINTTQQVGLLNNHKSVNNNKEIIGEQGTEDNVHSIDRYMNKSIQPIHKY